MIANLAHASQAAGRQDEAIGALLRLVERTQDNAEHLDVMLELANLLRSAGEKTAAIMFYQEILKEPAKLDDSQDEAIHNLARENLDSMSRHRLASTQTK